MPDSDVTGNAAPIRSNDRTRGAPPIGLVVFAGSGTTDNLADKSRKLVEAGEIGHRSAPQRTQRCAQDQWALRSELPKHKCSR